MSERWLILADDLTGAADSGVAFARRGWSTEAFWGETSPGDEVDVWAFDTDSRRCAPGEAGRRHRDALHRWLTPDRLLFKKIDSTLRGNRRTVRVAAGSRKTRARHFRCGESRDGAGHP
jgi:uncharacterized protein YgbK (DUF1537 family)